MIAEGLLLIFCVGLIVFPLISAYKSPNPQYLAHSSKITDKNELITLQGNIVDSFLKDEKAFKGKHISERIWNQRQRFWLNRYLDASRQLVYVHAAEKNEQRPQ